MSNALDLPPDAQARMNMLEKQQESSTDDANSNTPESSRSAASDYDPADAVPQTTE